MALGQDILNAVAALSTKIDTLIAAASANVIDPTTAKQITDSIAAAEARVDAAIAAHTPPPAP